MATTHLSRPDAPRAPERDWMSMEDFCAELGIAPSTAYKWSSAGPRSGRFPRFRKLPNGSIRIRRDWLEEWLDGLGPVGG